MSINGMNRATRRIMTSYGLSLDNTLFGIPGLGVSASAKALALWPEKERIRKQLVYISQPISRFIFESRITQIQLEVVQGYTELLKRYIAIKEEENNGQHV